MTILVLGLVLFLGAHSVRIVAEDWRAVRIARRGPNGWKALVTVASAAGLALIVWGYGLARAEPLALWQPAAGLRPVAMLLVALSFVLIAAAYVPRNRIRAAVGHPMVAGVTVWALGHLLVNGRAAGIVLFGAFLLWAIFDFRAARARDRAAGTRYPAGTLAGDTATIVAGLAVAALFARFLHEPLSGAPL